MRNSRMGALLAAVAAMGISASVSSDATARGQMQAPLRRDVLRPMGVAKSSNGRPAGANKAAQRAAMKKRRVQAHRKHARG